MKQFEGKTVLVTGASGFIGSKLAERFSSVSGIKLILLGREVAESACGSVLRFKCALSELRPGFWEDAGFTKIDYVFHLAAFTPKNHQEANSLERVVSDNICGTHTLLASLTIPVGKLIYSSTLDVYEKPKTGDVLSEASRLSPETLYGSSKLFCEKLVTEWSKQNNVDCSVLRYGHIYGPGEEKYCKLIPLTINKLLQGKSPVVFGKGEDLRDFLYVEDAVEATIRAACKDCRGAAINIVSGSSVPILNIVQTLVRLVNPEIDIQFIPASTPGVSLRFDSSGMFEVLGRWSLTALEDGLASEIKAHKERANEQ
jgi:nucleoside-diphosphate-sugar epimerase